MPIIHIYLYIHKKKFKFLDVKSLSLCIFLKIIIQNIDLNAGMIQQQKQLHPPSENNGSARSQKCKKKYIYIFCECLRVL